MLSSRIERIDGRLVFYMRPRTGATRLKMREYLAQMGIDEEKLDDKDVRQERLYAFSFLASLTENIEIDPEIAALDSLATLWDMIRSGRSAKEWGEYAFENVPDVVYQEWIVAQRLSEIKLLSVAEAAPELLSETERSDPK